MRSKLLLLVALLFTSASVVFAQTGTIKGKVSDKKNGDVLSGARVTLTDTEGKVSGKVTNKDGVYDIAVKPGKYTVSVTYTGYKSGSTIINVDVGATADANFQLVLDVKGLDEVVVTGVASRTQKSVSEVAVGRVNAADLTDKVGYTSAGQLLQGKVSGVTITPASGQVGGGIRFNVRAGAGLFAGNPVVFIDGVRVGAGNVGAGNIAGVATGIGSGGQQVSSLADLNPADIEDIQILKGAASAALYGTAGQNGVVLITTKRGKNRGNNELTITYQGFYGINQQSREITRDMAIGFADANRVFRQGLIQQHGVSLQGNSGIFNYYASFEDRNEQGIVVQNDLKRQNFRVNLEAVTSKDLTLRASANYTENVIGRPQNDNNIFGWMGNTMLFSNVVPSGDSVIPRPFGTYQFTDSTAILAYENTFRTRRLIASGELNYVPSWLPGFTLRGVVGYDVSASRNDILLPANQFYSGVTRGRRQILNLDQERLNFDLSATYAYSLGESVKGTTILGAQAFNNVIRNSFIAAERFGTGLVRDIGSGESTTFSLSEGFANLRDGGIFLRQEFSIGNFLSVSGAVRNDYASSVNPTAAQIFYPQASTALRVDKLNVLPEVINLLKVRAAYGETGSLPNLFAAAPLNFTTSQSGHGPGGIVAIAGNPSILPERIRELEVGLDVEFDNAYGAELTYIYSNAFNSILNVPRPNSSGLNGAVGIANGRPSNLGRVTNWGVETNLYAKPLQTTDYSLDFNLIFNYFDNIVEDLGLDAGGPEFLQDGFSRQYIIPGQRRGQFIGPRPLAPRFRADGYYDYVSGPQMDTARANGAIYTRSGNFLGHAVAGAPGATPPFTGSFSVNFRFLKDFTLYGLLEYGIGGFVYNGTRQFHTNPTYANNYQFNVLANQLGLARGLPGATGQGTIGNIPRYRDVTPLQPNTPEYRAASERFMRMDWISVGRGNVYNFAERSDWARLREVSLRWNGTSAINSLIGSETMKSLSIGVSVLNAWLWTSYTGPEVEVNGNPTSVIPNVTQDFLTMQQTRSVNLMVTVGF